MFTSGEHIKFQLESCRTFHLPIDPLCPLILIGTGTGFSPLRGLLQKRFYLKSRGEKLGPSYLIFGARCSKEGLFVEEINILKQDEVLTEEFVCYSREPRQKRETVTTKLETRVVQDILSPLLKMNDTHSYICGSAVMAEECKTALGEISSSTCIDAIESAQRLHYDLFGEIPAESKIRRNSILKSSSVKGFQCLSNM